MQLIYHDKLAFRQMSGVAFLCQHHGQAFRRRHQDVRGFIAKLHPLVRRCITGAQMNSELFLQPHPEDGRADVLLEIVSQCSQGRDVDALHAGTQCARVNLPQQRVKNPEKRRQRFAASRR